MWLFKKKEDVDVQLLIVCDNRRANPTVQSIFGFGSAHNKISYLTNGFPLWPKIKGDRSYCQGQYYEPKELHKDMGQRHIKKMKRH